MITMATVQQTRTALRYEPDRSAPQDGEFDWSGVKNRGELNQQGDPAWRQHHDALVYDAVHAWSGDPVTVTPQMLHELNNEPTPGSGSGKQMRARGAALLWELQHKSRFNDKTLYRGDTHDNTASRRWQAWTEDKRVAGLWARKGRGTIATAPPGSLKGLKSEDYIGSNMGEREWIIDRDLTPGAQIKTSTLHQATVTPQQIKVACWSHGFLDLMGKVFGAPSYYNDPVHGGCRLVAEALHILIPGSSIKAIVPDSPGHREFVEHYVVQAGTQYLDANGAHSAHELLTDWAYHGFELDSTGEPSNAFVDVTPALLARNSGIASPPGAAEKAAEYIREYRG